jgi:hypothetical protein
MVSTSRRRLAWAMENAPTSARAPRSFPRIKVAPLILAAAVGCVAMGVRAQTPPAVEAKAVDAMNQMGAYLRSVPAFQITLLAQRDDVDENGQLITLTGGATYLVRRPNAFSIELALPTQAGRYVYDGRTVSAYDARANQYKTFAAPSTIRATLELAQEKYGATVPLDDLFKWSEGGSDWAKALTSAHYIGKARIAGQVANHYAFRQPGRDWQIWIAEGDKPTPLRMSITASDDPARPKFQADLAWDTAPQFAQGAFVFAPPPNAKAIQ